MTPEEMFEKVAKLLGMDVMEVYCTPYVTLIAMLVEMLGE